MISPGRYVQLVDGEATEPTEVLPGVLENPSDGSLIGGQRASSAESVEAALAAATAAWEDGGWSALPTTERVEALDRFAAALEPHVEQLALVDAIDSGMPIRISRLFAGSLPATTRAAGAEALAAGDAEVLEAEGRRVELLRLPWGPTAILTPWNAPSGVAIGKVAGALAAGCPVILKPSEFGPSFAQVFAAAALEAELPSGALQIVHGDAAVASRLVGDSRVRAVSLTGGQPAGRAVAAAAAPRMAALQLELGGSNPAVVADDADVAASALALADGTAKLNGQWCEAPRRVFVARSLHDDLRDALVESLSGRRIGAVEDEQTQIGPLAHRGHLAKVREQVAALGGRQLATAAVPASEGFYLSPTVVVDVSPQAAAEEIFGPVLTLHPVDSDREAIANANANGDGLAAYVFSEDLQRAFEIGRRLHAGEIRIGGANLVDLAPGSTQSFWGASGIGAHGNRQVLEAFRGSRIIGEENPELPF